MSLSPARQRLLQSQRALRRTVVLPVAGAQTVGADKIGFVMPEAGDLRTVHAYLGTVNTGATFIVDVNKNGTTVFTTQTRRPTIAAGAATKSAESGVIEVTSLAKGDRVTVDVDQVGSTVAGTNLSVTITYDAK